jgi:hypothetical protein
VKSHCKEYYCEHWKKKKKKKKMKKIALMKLEIFGGLFYFHASLQFQCQLLVIMVENFYTRSFQWRICRTKRIWEHHNLFASLLPSFESMEKFSITFEDLFPFSPSNCRIKDSCDKSCINFGWVFIDDKALQMKR